MGIDCFAGMVLKQSDVDKVVVFVKQEPKTIQEVAKLLGRSWVTAESYVQQIKERTGLVNIKTFRKGSQGALKVVYYNYKESLVSEDVKKDLYHQIRQSRKKEDFDAFEIFQFVPDEKKKAFTLECSKDLPKNPQFSKILQQATHSIYFFSGNMSFLALTEGKRSIIDAFEELLKRKVHIKILCRVDVASINNIMRLKHLLEKYPEFIELRHSRQPLRGFIIDDSLARFSNEALITDYKTGELLKNVKFFYEIYDAEWIEWLQKVFWSLFRTSLSHEERMRQFEKFL
jgi:predicted transcriptional regulator